MKKPAYIILTVISALCLSSGAVKAQTVIDDIVSVDKTVHDFGDLYSGSGPVSATFTFKNISDKPFLLFEVVSSCGCTEAQWTREPIQPGKTGTVTATYNNEDGPYPFDKTITVYLSELKKPIVLHIRGSVHDRAMPLTETYPIIIGNLGLKSVEIKAGNLSQRDKKSGNIVIANVGVTPMKVQFQDVSDGLKLGVYPNPIPAKSTATLSYTITASRERWGKNWYYATPVIDGRIYKAVFKSKEKNNEEETGFYTEKNTRIGAGKSEIGFWATTKENFSSLPEDYKEDGPNPAFAKSTVSFGKVAAGTKTTLTFEYTNKGKRESEFFKLDADCHNVTVKEMEKTEAGKKGRIIVELDTKGMPKGDNIIALSLYTNSPLRPVVSLQIEGTIQ
ncbi:MAG: DUF1573 domain-containing protein [Bacteroidia bacterium]|nr:DUF1573 domain-containing protein [Bacteroidia bacterium]